MFRCFLWYILGNYDKKFYCIAWEDREAWKQKSSKCYWIKKQIETFCIHPISSATVSLGQWSLKHVYCYRTCFTPIQGFTSLCRTLNLIKDRKLFFFYTLNNIKNEVYVDPESYKRLKAFLNPESYIGFETHVAPDPEILCNKARKSEETQWWSWPLVYMSTTLEMTYTTENSTQRLPEWNFYFYNAAMAQLSSVTIQEPYFQNKKENLYLPPFHFQACR